MKTVLFSVFILASVWALPNGPNEPLIKRLYVDSAVERVSDLMPRIINGEEAEPHSIPYQAHLIFRNGNLVWFCGGSLISPTHVLTACHCLDGAKTATVMLGAYNIWEDKEPTRVTLQSSNFTCHDDFDENTIAGDIGLIAFDKPVELNENVNVVRLPSREEASNFEGVSALMSGWGYTDVTGNTSPFLFRANSTVISNVVCKGVFDFINDYHICTFGYSRACSGDSGGPLVYDDMQIGIISFGQRDCPEWFPDGLTRVTYYLDWLEKMTGLKF